ncbi:ATP-binding cassette domain-containing protein [Halocatena marina]|uniref:ABC transporter ATP-binding protein n=1 Tax=Halocatena marina TaxID=2934937 RepID=UPI00361D4102
MAAIKVKDLTKDYGSVPGVDSLSFTVDNGEIFGFLGPNGSGKTTTIRTLLGLLTPTAGTATILGADVREENALIEAKRRIGYLPADLGFNDDVTGTQVLEYHASVKGDSRRTGLLDVFTPPLDQQIREYSTGNKQLLGIIQAFMHDPDLVIMDEPTSGLDPLNQAQFNEFINAERERGTTIFFSSHVLSEVRRVCDRVGILRDGRLVGLENMEALLERGGKRVHVRVADGSNVDLTATDGVFDRTTIGDEQQFTYAGDYTTLIRQLADYQIHDIEITEPPLEDIFMHYYGERKGSRALDRERKPMFETARYEARRRLRGTAGLVAILSVYVGFMTGLYRAINIEAYGEIINAVPASLREALGIVDLSVVEGWLAAEVYYFFWIWVLGIYFGYTAAGLITDDIEHDRLDLLLSFPFSRSRLLREILGAVRADPRVE